MAIKYVIFCSQQSACERPSWRNWAVISITDINFADAPLQPGWLDVPPWLGLSVALAVAAGSVWHQARPVTPVFHRLLLAAPLLFLLSGAYVDAQSYRYLMPAFGAL